MTYIDHHAEPHYIAGKEPDYSITHSWVAHTRRTLTWLYGPNHQAERAAQTAADLAAWSRLGNRTGEAA